MLLLTIREALACVARFSVDVIQDESVLRVGGDCRGCSGKMGFHAGVSMLVHRPWKLLGLGAELFFPTRLLRCYAEKKFSTAIICILCFRAFCIQHVNYSRKNSANVTPTFIVNEKNFEF